MTSTRSRSDFEVRDDIVHLLDASGVPAEHIGVAVNHGAVSLFGEVTDRDEHDRVVSAVVTTVDRASVTDCLVVASSASATDAEISRCVDRAIGELRSRVSATVRWGVVTVAGVFDDLAQQDSLCGAIAGIDGVVSVVNAAAIQPRVTDAAVHRVVEEVLRDSAANEGAHVRVDVDGHRVTLAGCVHSTYERRAAQYAVEAMAGVAVVNNNLDVLD